MSETCQDVRVRLEVPLSIHPWGRLVIPEIHQSAEQRLSCRQGEDARQFTNRQAIERPADVLKISKVNNAEFVKRPHRWMNHFWVFYCVEAESPR